MSAEFILHNVIRKLGEIRDSGMLPGIDDASRPDEILGTLFERYKELETAHAEAEAEKALKNFKIGDVK